MRGRVRALNQVVLVVEIALVLVLGELQISDEEGANRLELVRLELPGVPADPHHRRILGPRLDVRQVGGHGGTRLQHAEEGVLHLGNTVHAVANRRLGLMPPDDHVHARGEERLLDHPRRARAARLGAVLVHGQHVEPLLRRLLRPCHDELLALERAGELVVAQVAHAV